MIITLNIFKLNVQLSALLQYYHCHIMNATGKWIRLQTYAHIVLTYSLECCLQTITYTHLYGDIQI